MSKSIKQIKKELGIGNRDIADAFGYANSNSFATSHRRLKIENGIKWIYHLTKQISEKQTQNHENVFDRSNEG